jgi:WD40 repeat protein
VNTGFEQLSELFGQIRRIPVGAEREAALQKAVGSDVRLRQRLEELIAHHDAADTEGFRPLASVLSLRAIEKALDPEEEAFPDIPGHHILRRLGAGGMGTVYLAEQDRPQRRVAVKLLRLEYATPDGRRRFEREADLLARLQHPGVAQIHGQGIARTALGERPYLSMEYVPGLPLTEFADREVLGIRARVVLLRRVCDAVAHLHENGVIHRDLKPSNILVTVAGEPKVLDFGVAKPLEAGDSVHTHAGAVVGTLTYMSPEQALGTTEMVDTRSDVYALGVLAYELLAGCLPYDVGGRSLSASVHTIAEVDPPKLGRVDRRLRGDLSVIVAKALDKDKDRRYSGAAAMAEDLRRHLDDEAVHASTVSALYATRKFVRRHTGWVVGAAAFVVALLVGMVLSLHLKQVADEEAAAARAANRLARLQAAAAALRNDENSVLREHLDAISPALRGWAWAYLDAQADVSLASESVPCRHAAALGPDGIALVAGHTPWQARVRSAGGLVWSSPVAIPLSVQTSAVIAGERLIVATSHTGGRCQLTDIRTGAVFHTLEGRGVPSMVVGATGRKIAVSVSTPGRRPRIQLIDAVSGKSVWRRDGVEGHVRAIGPRDQWVAVAAENHDDVLLYEVGSSAPPKRLAGAAGYCRAATFSADGRWLACGSLDHTVRIWALPARTLHHEISGLSTVPRTLLYLDDGRLAIGLEDGSIRMWEGRSREMGDTLAGHARPIRAMSGAGDLLHSITDRNVRRWWIGKGPPQRIAVHGQESRTKYPPFVYFARFTPDGSRIVSGGWDGYVRITDAATGTPLIALEADGQVVSMGIGARGRILACGGEPLRLFDLGTGKQLGTVDLAEGTQRASLSPDGELLAMAGASGVLEVVERRSGARRFRVQLAPVGRITHISFDPASALIAVMGERGGVVMCRASDGAVKQRLFPGHTCHTGVFSADRRLYAVGSGGGLAYIVEASTGHTRHVLPGQGEGVLAVAFSGTGAELATGGTDGIIRLWDVRTGALLLRLRGHTRYVKDLSFSPDGRTLISASGDGSVRVWSTRAFAERHAEAEAMRMAEVALAPRVEGWVASGQSLGALLEQVADAEDLSTLQKRAMRGLVLRAAAR